MATFVERLVGTARLNAAMYEEVEADQTATTQALGVVALSSLAAGLGIGAGLAGLILGVLVSLAGWYVWAFLTYWIGTRLLPEPGTRSSLGEMLRVIGFSSGPGLLRVLGLLPPLRDVAFAVAFIWMLVAGVVAVRQALDYSSTWRAVAVVAIGWLTQVVLFAVASMLFGGRAW